jgi:hypothetical protein
LISHTLVFCHFLHRSKSNHASTCFPASLCDSSASKSYSLQKLAYIVVLSSGILVRFLAYSVFKFCFFLLLLHEESCLCLKQIIQAAQTILSDGLKPTRGDFYFKLFPKSFRPEKACDAKLSEPTNTNFLHRQDSTRNHWLVRNRIMKKKMASRPNVMLNESQTDQASFLRNEVFATFFRKKSRRNSFVTFAPRQHRLRQGFCEQSQSFSRLRLSYGDGSRRLIALNKIQKHSFATLSYSIF